MQSRKFNYMTIPLDPDLYHIAMQGLIFMFYLLVYINSNTNKTVIPYVVRYGRLVQFRAYCYKVCIMRQEIQYRTVPCYTVQYSWHRVIKYWLKPDRPQQRRKIHLYTAKFKNVVWIVLRLITGVRGCQIVACFRYVLPGPMDRWKTYTKLIKDPRGSN